MHASKRTFRWSTIGWTLVCLGALSLSSVADAARPPIAIGEVTSQVSRPYVDLNKALRAELERQVVQVDLKGARENFILSASLVQLDTQAAPDRTRSTCVVQAALRRARTGAILAVLRGKARAEDGPAQKTSTEIDAMKAAVHSALQGIPQAVR